MRFRVLPRNTPYIAISKPANVGLETLWRTLFQVLIDTIAKARRADGQKDEVSGAGVGDALGAHGGNDNDVSRANLCRWQITDLNQSCADDNAVALRCAFQTMPAGGSARCHPCPGDG